MVEVLKEVDCLMSCQMDVTSCQTGCQKFAMSALSTIILVIKFYLFSHFFSSEIHHFYSLGFR
jgi:hypothetical protein